MLAAGDVDVAAAAALIGEPARAALLIALTESEYLPARELAARAGIAPSTASGHLARLLEGDLVVAQRVGRHGYFRLANAGVAEAIEALSAIAPVRAVRSLREASVGEALRQARTCYDHIGGRLGVELTAVLERDGVLVFTGEDSYRLGANGAAYLEAEFGRALARPLARRNSATIDEAAMVAGCLAALGGPAHKAALAALRSVSSPRGVR